MDNQPGPGFGVFLLVGGFVILLVTFVALRVAWKRGGIGSVPPPDRPLPTARLTDGVELPGGGYVNGVAVSWPGAVLAIDRTQAELRVEGLQPVRFTRDEALRVRYRRGLASGLVFETASGRLDHVRFAPVPKRAALLELARLGWEVDPPE